MVINIISIPFIINRQNFNIYNPFTNLHLSLDPCEGVTCDVTGEVCKEGLCMCGDSKSCAGNMNGSYCDSIASQCKCAQDVEACTQHQECVDDSCKGIVVYIDKTKCIYKHQNSKLVSINIFSTVQVATTGSKQMVIRYRKVMVQPTNVTQHCKKPNHYA